MAAGRLSYDATDLRTAQLLNGYIAIARGLASYVASCGMIFAALDFVQCCFEF